MNSPTARPNCCWIDRGVAGPRNARDALREAAALLDFLLPEEARIEADVLLAHALGVARTALYAHPDRQVPPDRLGVFRELLRRRADRVPLQYLTGRVSFMGFELKVDRRALIPRPETEWLVEAALDHAPEGDGLRFADVGTGSGCIAIALARALPHAGGLATDLSPDALVLAAENARRLGVGDRIAFLGGDLLEPVRRLGATLDLICSNPPYVTAEEYATLAPEIRDHEPRSALVAGEAGMAFYRRLFREAPACLRPDGVLAVELADSACASVVRLLGGVADLEPVEVRRDLAGIERVLLARRKGSWPSSRSRADSA